jgi:O-antigen ligase
MANASSNAGKKSHTDSAVIGLAILLFLIPVIWLPYILDEPFQLPKLIVLRLGAALIFALWLIDAVRKRQVSITGSPVDIPIASFLLIAVASTASSISLVTSLDGYKTSYEGLYTIINYVLVYWLASQVIRKRSHLWTVIPWMVAGGVIVAIYGLAQKAGLDFTSWEALADTARSFSTLGSPTHLGGYLAFLLPIGIAFSLSREQTRTMRAILLLANLILMITLYFTYTRASWIGAAIGLSLLLFLLRGDVKVHVRSVAGAGIAVIIGVLLLSYVSPTSTTYLPIQRLISSADQGLERIAIWSGSLISIADRPILGHGPATFGLVNPVDDIAHNWLLDIASNLGIFGLLAFIWIVTVAVLMTVKKVRALDDRGTRFVVAGFASACIAYFIHMLFSFSYVGLPAPWWAGLGLIAAVPPQLAQRTIRFALPKRLTVKVAIAISSLFLLLYGGKLLTVFAAEKYFSDGLRSFNEQNYNMAGQSFEKALKLNPGNSRYLLQLGETYFWLAINTQTDLYVDEAVNALRRAIRQDPFEERSYFLLIQLYAVVGESEKAAGTLDDLLAINPTTKRLARCLSRSNVTSRRTLR